GGVRIHGLQRGGDGGKRGMVTDQQVAARLGLWGVAAAGAVHGDEVPGLGRVGPPGGDPAVLALAVQHDVDVDALVLVVPAAHGVGAAGGHQLGAVLAQPVHVVGGPQAGGGVGQQQLDVGV